MGRKELRQAGAAISTQYDVIDLSKQKPTAAFGSRLLEMIMRDVILRDFDGNTLSSQLLNWISPQRYSDLTQASGNTGSLTGNFFTNACARLFSPTRVIGQFSNTAKTYPGKEGFFVLQTTNSPILEHIFFSDQVSDECRL
jgi:hypothetical protein